MARSDAVPAEAIERYDALIATLPGVERKGRGMPYTSVNGHMFSFLTPGGTLALRLPASERDAFLEAHDTRLIEQHGRPLKEYVAVPDSLFDQTDALAPYVAASYRYVASLKPKGSTKR
jgi:hypothetical protein